MAFSPLRSLLCALLVLCATAAHSGTRITSTSLTYLGTASITHSDGSCAESPNARALGLTYNPAGNGGAGSFFISHRWNSPCMAEITKPAVGGTATYLQNFQPVLGNLGSLDAQCSNGCYIGGHLLHAGNLYVTGFTYYDADGNQPLSIWTRSPTLSSTAGRTGPVAAVSPGNQGMANAWMDNVPAAHQAALGTAVIGGCCWSIITRTSLGPALYSFNPSSLGAGTALVQYPDGHQTLNQWGASGSHPEANPTTKIGGMTFVDGTDTVLFLGNTGTGAYCYGGTECNDPDAPESKGAHAYPYVHYVWAYDVDDLAAAKAGTINPWDVQPYAMWELPNLGNVTYIDEWSIIGAAFDPAANRLYVLKSRETNGSAWPQLHIYAVNTGGGGGDTTPPAVAVTAPSAGATVSGSTTVSASCTDNTAVQSVQFRVDGVAHGAADTTAPFSITWDTTIYGNGSRSLSAVCTDTSGNAATSAAVSVTVDNGGGGAGTRIQSSNLTYLGTANITHNEGACGGNYEKAPGLALNPAGNGGAGSLYIAGRRNANCVAEITKPAPGGTATYLQTFVDPVGGVIDSIDDGTGGADDCQYGCWVGGLLVMNSRLFLTGYVYYDSNNPRQDSTLFNHSLTLTSNADRTGPLVIGAGSPSVIQRMQYMAPIPSAHRSRFGGRPAVVGGCCMNIISQSSYGPALWAFDPASPGAATSIVGYPEGHATLRPWGEQPPNPLFNPVTRIAAVTFIDGSDTVLFIGHTGTGSEYCYGYTTYTQSLNGQNAGQGDGLPWCYDPNMAAGQLGTHIYPKAHYAWAYDVDDLAAAYAGTVSPWDVMPYAAWELPDLGSVADSAAGWFPDNSISGAVFDPATNRLYVAKGRQMSDSAPFYSQLHIYSISGLSGDVTAPSVALTSPSNGATVSGTVTLSASCTDNIGVASVQFRVDGSNVGGPDAAPPFAASWATNAFSNGASVALTAVCTDTSGNTATSAPVSVTVSNGIPPVAGFTCSPLTLQAPATTSCTDSSSNSPTSWAWVTDCGNSSERNPSFNCQYGGVKTFCLTAGNFAGSSPQFCRSEYVTVKLRPPTNVGAQ